jgi:hypothetical protein
VPSKVGDCQTACCNVWRFTVLVTDGIHTNYCQLQVNLTVTCNILNYCNCCITAAVECVGTLQTVCIKIILVQLSNDGTYCSDTRERNHRSTAERCSAAVLTVYKL